MRAPNKTTKRSAAPVTFNEKTLYAELMRDAKAVGLATGAAEVIVNKILAKVSAYLATRAVVTTDDINRLIAQEAERYNKDLAYVYQNRGKII